MKYENRLWIACGLCSALAVAALPACTRHRVTVDPIHVTVDVNIKVDRELDSFFAFEEEIPVEQGASDQSINGKSQEGAP